MPETAQYRDGVAQALKILAALGRADEPLRVAQLAAGLGIPRTSLYRIVRIMAARNIVELKGGKLRPGPLVQSIVTSYLSQNERSGREERARLPRDYGARAAPGDIPPDGTIRVVQLPFRARTGMRRFRIGFSNASQDNPWRTALIHSIEAAASNLGDRLGELSVRHAQDSVEQQSADIADFVAEGVDGLIVSAVDPKRSRPAIEAAVAAGVPVVLVDRGLDSMGFDSCLVSADDRFIGKATATWLAETIGGTGKILMLSGREDAEPARIRLKAARECFARWPALSLEHHWADWQRDAGFRLTRNAIASRHEPIAGVWADSGLQGVGAIEAFLDAGFKPGTIPPHTGGDLNVVYKLALRNRVRLAAVDYPPAMGLHAVETLVAVMSGRWVPDHIAVRSPVIITKGAATQSVRPDRWAEDHVRWDLPDELILASGLGQNYSPRSFRVHYPGNRYNRSAAERKHP